MSHFDCLCSQFIPLWVIGSLVFSLVLSSCFSQQPSIQVLVEVELGCFQLIAISPFYYIPTGNPLPCLAG